MNNTVNTIYTPPKVNNSLWKNSRLWNKFNSMENYSLTLLTANPGYGKTTNLAYYVKNNYSENYFWFSIPDNNINKYNFWTHIVNSIALKQDQIRTELNSLHKLKEKQIEISYFIEYLINYLYHNLKTPSILVIDNFDKSSENCNILNDLNYLIELIPSKLHIVILSNKKIKFPDQSLWEIEQKILKITENDFVLNNNQINNFMLHKYKTALSKNQIERLSDYTEGWITALNLLGKYLQKGNELDYLLCKKSETIQIIYRYFDKIIHNKKLASSEYSFLLKASLLKTIEKDTCNYIFQFPDSETIINNLYNNGVFIKKTDDKYRFQNLFQQYLIHKAEKEDDINKFRQILIDYHKINNNQEKVTYHLFKLQDQKTIINYIHEKGDYLLENNLELLTKCLTRIDNKHYYNHILLYIYQGDLNCRKDNFKLAIENYNQALKLARKKNNTENIYRSLLKMTKLYINFYSTECSQYLKELLKEYPEKNTEQIKSLILGEKIIRGDFQSIDNFLASNGHDLDCYKKIKAYFYLFKGELDKTEGLINNENYPELSNTLPFTVHITPLLYFIITGKLYKAQEYAYEKLMENNNQNSILNNIISFYLSVAEILNRQKFDVSFLSKYLQDSPCKIDFPVRSSWHINDILLCLTMWESYFGDPEKGKKYGECGLELKNDSPSKGGFYFVMGVNHYTNQRFHLAGIYFERAKKIYNYLNINIFYCSSLLFLALTYRKSNEKNYLQYLQKSLELSCSHSYDFLYTGPSLMGFWNSSPQIIPLLLEARKNGIEPGYIDRLLTKLNLADIDRHPGYHLEISTLGGLKVSRNNQLIEWKNNKIRDLFLFLLINRDNQLPIKKICSKLWPDKNSKSARNNFYVTLNRLNKLIDPDKKSGQDSFFISKNNSKYSLKKAAINYDGVKFEEVISRGKMAEKKLFKIYYFEKAVQIYKGNFLPEINNDYVNRERERYKQLYKKINQGLMNNYFSENNYQRSLEYANNILNIDICYERAYLMKMKSLNLMGHRIKAIRTYKKCEETLQKLLIVEPGQKLKDYYQTLIV